MDLAYFWNNRSSEAGKGPGVGAGFLLASFTALWSGGLKNPGRRCLPTIPLLQNQISPPPAMKVMVAV